MLGNLKHFQFVRWGILSAQLPLLLVLWGHRDKNRLPIEFKTGNSWKSGKKPQKDEVLTEMFMVLVTQRAPGWSDGWFCWTKGEFRLLRSHWGGIDRTGMLQWTRSKTSRTPQQTHHWRSFICRPLEHRQNICSWPSSPNSLNPPAGDQTFLLLGRRTLCLILLSDYTILKQHQVFFHRYRGSVLGEIFNFRCFCFLWHCTWEFLTFFMHFLNTAEQIPADFLFSGLFSGTWFKFHRLEWEQAERSQTYRFRVTSVAQSLKMK